MIYTYMYILIFIHIIILQLKLFNVYIYLHTSKLYNIMQFFECLSISLFNELNMVENMLVLPRNMGIVSGSDQHVISFVQGQNSPRGKLKIPTFGATCQNSILECSNILKCWNVNFTPNSMALYGTVPRFQDPGIPID